MLEPCDLVMKGGITSGVIYPRLVARLAERYRFRSIGGSSAGAIAAAACAAAERGRLRGQADSFTRLAALPAELAQRTPGGESRLLSLFQPAAALRRHFAVLRGALGHSPGAALASVLRGIATQQAPLLALLGTLAAALQLPLLAHWQPAASGPALAAWALALCALWWAVAAGAAGEALTGRRLGAAALLGGGLLALVWGLLALGGSDAGAWAAAAHALVLACVASLSAVLCLALGGWRFARQLLRGLHAQGYGLCSGLGEADGQPALTPWLSAYLDQLAAQPAAQGPLRFRDLWGHDDPEAEREVHLEVMTSAVSQQTVHSVPFRRGTPCHYYEPGEWSRLFPPAVMQALATGADEEAGLMRLPPGTRVLDAQGRALRPLPRAADLPVVVAVRMSLSFPLLLSAVPLYVIDFSLASAIDQVAALRKAGDPAAVAALPLTAQRVWFSDGGIGSNLPLHMFDALLPAHPTFAINLKAEHPSHPIRQPERADNDGGRVYLPQDQRGGHLRHWTAPTDTRPASGLLAFLGSIVSTMQNWRDEMYFPYPGFRDRIVQISQRPDEGGLNLDMPGERIEALARAGEMAADRLIDRFHPAGAEAGVGWDQHRNARLRTLVGTLQPSAVGLLPALAQGGWHDLVGGWSEYSQAERDTAWATLTGLATMGEQGEEHDILLSRRAPRPLAQLRIAPRV